MLLLMLNIVCDCSELVDGLIVALTLPFAFDVNPETPVMAVECILKAFA